MVALRTGRVGWRSGAFGKSCRRAAGNICQRQHFEETAHLVGGGKAVQGGKQLPPLWRSSRLRERLCSLLDPQCGQEDALLDRPVDPGASLFGGRRECLKIDMSGEVRVARTIQWIYWLMSFHGLKAVSQRRLLIAVVDDQGRAAEVRESLADSLRDGSAGWRDFSDGPRRRLRWKWEDRWQVGAKTPLQSILRVIQTDHPLGPAVPDFLKLPDREGIEEFISQEQQGPVWQTGEIVMPNDLCRCQYFLLALSQEGTALYQVNLEGCPELRKKLGGS